MIESSHVYHGFEQLYLDGSLYCKIKDRFVKELFGQNYCRSFTNFVMVQVVLELCALGTIVVVDAHFICLINDGCKLLLNLKQVGSQLGLLKYGFGFGLNYQHCLGCFKPSFVKK